MSHGYVAVRAGKRNAGYNRVSENVRSPPVNRTLFHNRNRLNNKESIEIANWTDVLLPMGETVCEAISFFFFNE